MALHAFLEEGVDTAVVECGVGGEYDSTNVVETPVVCGVSSLGIDHVGMLGETIEEIAWHKAGIFKERTRASDVYTVDSQSEAAMAVLKRKAEEKGLSLRAVPVHKDIRDGGARLGLDAEFQKVNASLAVAVAAAHLRALGIRDAPKPLSDSPLPAQFREGLETVRWGGRCETRREAGLTWYLDGAHTLESIELVAEWFGSRTSAPHFSVGSLAHTDAAARGTTAPKRILLFNQQTRDASALARSLHTALSRSTASALHAAPPFTHAVFCTNVTFSSTAPGGAANASAGYKRDLVSVGANAADVSQLTVQRELAAVWDELSGGLCACEVRPSIEEAIAWVRGVAGSGEASVLVTGSLHLVGGVLEVLESVPDGKSM